MPAVRWFLPILLAACSAPGEALAPAPLPVPTARPPLRRPGPLSPRLASYRIDATLDPTNKRISATERLTWKHAGQAPVSSIPLHLYMNAFKNESSLFMSESRGQLRFERMSAGKWGWIEVSSIRLGTEELRPRARLGADETTMEVPLPSPVPPGGTVELDLAFTVQLPEVFARTGYKGDFVLAGQWFPKVGVLEVGPEGQAWHCEPFHAFSEFYADFGVYDVSLTVPDTHVVAATGVLVRVESAGAGLRRHVFHAEDVHDFAWMADPHMRTMQAEADGDVDVIVYHRPSQEGFARRHLAAAVRALEGYGRRFGAYPFSTLRVIDPPVDAAGGAGGMEYPMFVTTDGDGFLFGPGVFQPEEVTVHEVGHNWFQGVLASNEVDEPFLDEGLNEYAGGLILDEWLGAGGSIARRWGLELGYYPAHQCAYDPDLYASPIVARSYQFPTALEYGVVVYAKSAVALKTLENVVGREPLVDALGAYARKAAFRHPTRADLFAALETHLGPEAGLFLAQSFVAPGSVDYRIRDVHTRRAHAPRGVFGEGEGRKVVDEHDAPDGKEWIAEVVVENVGTVAVPVEIELVFADGARERRRWDGRAPSIQLTHRGPAELVEARVDPDGRIPLEHERLANDWRVPFRRPAWRAALRAGFWEQNLLQLVGL